MVSVTCDLDGETVRTKNASPYATSTGAIAAAARPAQPAGDMPSPPNEEEDRCEEGK